MKYSRIVFMIGALILCTGLFKCKDIANKAVHNINDSPISGGYKLVSLDTQSRPSVEFLEELKFNSLIERYRGAELFIYTGLTSPKYVEDFQNALDLHLEPVVKLPVVFYFPNLGYGRLRTEAIKRMKVELGIAEMLFRKYNHLGISFDIIEYDGVLSSLEAIKPILISPGCNSSQIGKFFIANNRFSENELHIVFNNRANRSAFTISNSIEYKSPFYLNILAHEISHSFDLSDFCSFCRNTQEACLNCNDLSDYDEGYVNLLYQSEPLGNYLTAGQIFIATYSSNSFLNRILGSKSVKCDDNLPMSCVPNVCYQMQDAELERVFSFIHSPNSQNWLPSKMRYDLSQWIKSNGYNEASFMRVYYALESLLNSDLRLEIERDMLNQLREVIEEYSIDYVDVTDVEYYQETIESISDARYQENFNFIMSQLEIFELLLNNTMISTLEISLDDLAR